MLDCIAQKNGPTILFPGVYCGDLLYDITHLSVVWASHKCGILCRYRGSGNQLETVFGNFLSSSRCQSVENLTANDSMWGQLSNRHFSFEISITFKFLKNKYPLHRETPFASIFVCRTFIILLQLFPLSDCPKLFSDQCSTQSKP